MIINEKYKFIFIAVPKTGTTSIEQFLLNNVEGSVKDMSDKHKHLTAREIKRKIPDYDNYVKITVVRNPYDWYVSWYTYRQRSNSKISSNGLTLKEYIEKYPMDEQVNFIKDSDGKVRIDYIIRFENGIETELIKILNKLRIPYKEISFDKINVSTMRKFRDYKEYYDVETKIIVDKLQKNTLRTFDYIF